MTTVGFIGVGSMGKLLVEALLKAGALEPSDVVVSNRTVRKAERFAEHYPGMRVAPNNVDLAKECDVIVLCVKPLEYGSVLAELKPYVADNQLVISITSPVLLSDIEQKISAKVVKVIPSVTNFALTGTSLVMYGSRLEPRERQNVSRLFGYISRPVEIDERDVRVASDLASCAPAFLSFLMQRLVEEATAVAGISTETAALIVGEMIRGVGQLVTDGGFTLTSLQERVAVPGGVTREGIDLLEREVGTVFAQLLQLTQQKHAHDISAVKQVLADV